MFARMFEIYFDTKLIKEGIKILISSSTYRDDTSMYRWFTLIVSDIIVSDLAVERKMGILIKSVVLIRRIELNNSSL